MARVTVDEFFESCRNRRSQAFQLGVTSPKRKRGVGEHNILKGLILAQNERWRRGLGMQVERIPLGNWGGKWRKGQ